MQIQYQISMLSMYCGQALSAVNPKVLQAEVPEDYIKRKTGSNGARHLWCHRRKISSICKGLIAEAISTYVLHAMHDSRTVLTFTYLTILDSRSPKLERLNMALLKVAVLAESGGMGRRLTDCTQLSKAKCCACF